MITPLVWLNHIFYEPIAYLSLAFEDEIGDKDSGLLAPKHIHQIWSEAKDR